NLGVLERTANQISVDLQFSQSRNEGAGIISVIDPVDSSAEYQVGIDAAESGKASARYIEAAVALWREGAIDAIATAPISKKAISLAGYQFPGHTEFLAHLTGTKKVVMSFFAGDLRVVLLSTHVSLRDAIEKVTSENLAELVIFSTHELQRLL